MKKSLILGGALTSLFLASAIFVGCNSPEKKVENAEENLKEAKQELSQMQMDSVADFENFKRESELKIDENEKVIADYKAKMSTENSKLREKDQKRIDELEQKNINMRKKIEAYKEDGKDDWAAFKVEFSHDMDELGAALKGLTVKNTK